MGLQASEGDAVKKFLFLGALLILAPWPTRPAGAGQVVSLGYNVYLGGLHIVSFNMDITLDRSEYSISAAGVSRGVVGLFYDWSTRLDANGRLGPAGFRPTRYDAVTKRKGKVKSRRLVFGGDGEYSVERDPPKRKKQRKLPLALTRNTVDPLTAVLAVTSALVADGGCTRTIPVFDGKRRFNLLFKQVGPDTVAPSQLSIFKGLAVQCRFTTKRIAGFKKKRRYFSFWDESEKNPLAVWVATLADGAPPVPVRFEGDFKLGALMIHLVRAEVKSTAGTAVEKLVPVP